MNKDTISVVMATYNGAKYIKEQLESIFNQSVTPDEIIISDDCSKDSTLKILEDYKNEVSIPITINVNKENIGYIKNFKLAISRAKGDYIFLCDQDDVWEKNKIEDTISCMKSVDAEVSCTGFILIDGNGNRIKDLNKYKSDPICGYEAWTGLIKEIQIKRLIWGNFCPGCTYCFSKSVKAVFERLNNVEMPHDFQLLLIGANHRSAVFIDKPLSRYRIHESNTIGMNKKEAKRKRNIKPRMTRFFDELSNYELIDHLKIYNLILFLRLPKIRYEIIKRFKLNNKMCFEE